MNKKGFTLIELIIVIAIIAILAAISFVAVNPAKRIGEANDDQRWADVISIAEAWEKYETDTGGEYPNGWNYADSDTEIMQIGTSSGVDVCDAVAVGGNPINITLQGLVDNGYLGSIPVDPLGADTNGNTNYYFQKSGGIVTVGACITYGTGAIVVSR